MVLPKLYLDGFDWIANLLNYQCRNTPGQGNHFMLVLQSAELFTEDGVRRLLKPLNPVLPMLNGSIRRHRLHLAPYWLPGKPEQMPFTQEKLRPESDFHSAMELFGNSPLPQNKALAIHLITHKEGSALLFKFSHLLFDGRGAEILLEAIRGGNHELLQQTPGLNSPKLDEWGKQFSSGRQVQHTLQAIRKEGPTVAKRADNAAPSHYRVISLTEAETDELRLRSDRDAGPFMLTPYLLSLTGEQYNKLIPQSGKQENILVPMSIDMRGQDSIPQDALFFNQWSILPVRLKREGLDNVSQTIPEIRRQIFANTGERTALAYRAASRLMRIAPPPILLHIVKKMGNSTTGSFMFSFISGTSLEQTKIAGRVVSNLYHLPGMPPITGFGVFFNMFNSRLNAVVSYRDGVFPETDVERFTEQLEKTLKGEA